MINWKVRFKNINFWMEIIPAVLLLAQLVMELIGYPLPDLLPIEEKLLKIVNVIFAILATLGVITDPTTHGTGDSQRAMTYDIPYKDVK